MKYKHIPVMLKEAVEYLKPEGGGYFIDCTLGGGGYTLEIAKRVGKSGKVLAVDLDEMAIENFKFKILNLKLDNIILANENFKNLSKIVQDKFAEGKDIKFNGIVFDLGLSQAQLRDRSRGFSFQVDAPLDMAFNNQTRKQKNNKTEDIVNKFSEEGIRSIIREYGEERFAGRIARAIVNYRKLKYIKTTGQLVEIIGHAVPGSYKNKRIHFATRTFQALRIAANKELENLEEALPRAVELLRQGGRMAVVSYHSLEDRIVKNFFKKESKDCLCPPEFPICQCGHKAKLGILTTKPVRPAANEIIANPSARSAKLRAAVKI